MICTGSLMVDIPDLEVIEPVDSKWMRLPTKCLHGTYLVKSTWKLRLAILAGLVDLLITNLNGARSRAIVY